MEKNVLVFCPNFRISVQLRVGVLYSYTHTQQNTVNIGYIVLIGRSRTSRKIVLESFMTATPEPELVFLD